MLIHWFLEPGVVSNLQQSSVGTDKIDITWSTPTEPNGVITVYEIRYRKSNGDGLVNTTNTQYSIEGLLPNTNYTIDVRAYTSIGPGDWSSIMASTTGKSLIVEV